MDSGCFRLIWQHWCPIGFGFPCVGFLRRGYLCLYVRGGVWWWQEGVGASVCVEVGSWGMRGHWRLIRAKQILQVCRPCQPGLGWKDFWCYLGYLAGWGELRKR